jgi:hypothetical protein
MKKIIPLSLIIASALITGCKPTPPPAVDTHPANLVGKWKADFTTKIPSMIKRGQEEIVNLTQQKVINVTLQINLEAGGPASYEANQDGQSEETISGSWKQIDDFLIIERSNAGFVAFHISSQSTNQLTVFTRTGQTIQFNKIP